MLPACLMDSGCSCGQAQVFSIHAIIAQEGSNTTQFCPLQKDIYLKKFGCNIAPSYGWIPKRQEAKNK